MNLPDYRDAALAGKIVVLRADLNAPPDGSAIVDRDRIARCAATVTQLLLFGSRVVIIAHLLRPGGVVNPVMSIAPMAQALSDQLNSTVRFVPDTVGAAAERVTRSLPERGVALLENLRFHVGEEENDRSFAMMLSVHGDIYVNDAPSSSIRRHASIHALAGLMPAYAGPQLLAHAAGLNEAEALSLPGIEALMANTRTLEKV